MKFAESVEKLWLENYREEIDDTFPQTVTDLVLENCNLANIALPQKLKRLQVVGGDEPDENNLNTLKLADLKECLRRRPVPEQSWIDQPIEFSEIGDCSKLLYEHKNLDLYYSEKPLIYVGTDWERMSSELQKYTFSPEQIHHLCIVAIGFEASALKGITPMMGYFNIYSFKISTADENYYNNTLKPYAIKGDHKIVDISLTNTELQTVARFYLNREAKFMDCDNFGTPRSMGDAVKYLAVTIHDKEVCYASGVLEYFEGLRFLKITQSVIEYNILLMFSNLAVLAEGIEILNQYIDARRKNQRTEILFKRNNTRQIVNSNYFLLIPSNDNSYCFEFGSPFNFEYDLDVNEYALRSGVRFADDFLSMLAGLTEMKRLEIVGKTRPLTKYISDHSEESKLIFLKLKQLSYIRFNIQTGIPSTFFDVIATCQSLQYFIPTYSPSDKIINKDLVALALAFTNATGHNWTMAKFRGNRLINTFLLTNRGAEEDKFNELFQQRTLKEEFNELIKSKKPTFNESFY